MEEFALFLDDSGSPKPKIKDKTPHFAMGGVLVKRQAGPIIAELLTQFKTQWNIPQNVPLHGSEIRSKKRNFAWLGKLEKMELQRFQQELTNMVVQCPIIVHACVISRSGYHQRYLERYGNNTWEMMRTAFSILVERAVKLVARQDGKLIVYHEEIGRREDRLLKEYYKELRTKGHPFDPSTAARYQPLPQEKLAQRLSGIGRKTKESPELQIADLCLYPVAQIMEQPDNRAYQAMQKAGLLADCLLLPEEVEMVGIKYFCFDGKNKTA